MRPIGKRIIRAKMLSNTLEEALPTQACAAGYSGCGGVVFTAVHVV